MLYRFHLPITTTINDLATARAFVEPYIRLQGKAVDTHVDLLCSQTGFVLLPYKLVPTAEIIWALPKEVILWTNTALLS